MKFADRLKDLRKEKHLNQGELARILGVNQSTIANYEKNLRYPNVEILCQIADYFEVTIDNLIGREGNFVNRSIENHETIGDELLEVLLDNDYKRASQIFEAYYKETNTEAVFFKLMRYVLTKLGWLWELGLVSVSQEHQVSGLIDRMLNEVKVPHNGHKGVIVGMTAPHEKHTLGLKMLLIALSNYGYDVHYIGECVPLEDYMDFINKVKADACILSLTSPFFQEEVKKYFDTNVDKQYLVGMGTSNFSYKNINVYRDYEACLEAINE
jgi:transcriptional regulator with XRE-family HTH domain